MRTSLLFDQFGRRERRPRYFGFGHTPEVDERREGSASGADAVAYLLHDIDDEDPVLEIDGKAPCPQRTSGKG